MSPKLNQESAENLLSTFTDHIADQIAICVNDSSRASSGNGKEKLLITGGGANNTYLIECLQSKLNDDIEIVLPEAMIIDFKEAVIFAFLGLLRLLGENNCWKSVTGAKRDSSGGMLFDPPTS